jgi:LPXTG-motif cell wall-anchored protein/uncharacterized repeat protein (TIGR01451 family)
VLTGGIKWGTIQTLNLVSATPSPEVNIMYKITKTLLLFVYIFGLVALVGSSRSVYADGKCKPVYGGGETCVFNKVFEIEKKVRVKGQTTWRDKVVNVNKGEVVEFRVVVRNVGDIKTDKMKMVDILPDSMDRVGGDGLTQKWDNFVSGDKVEFIIEAKVKDSEFDRKNFEKCVVNKAEAYYKDKFEGADTATVCYGDAVITELPETGPTESMLIALTGFSFIGLGAFVRRKLSI